MSKQDRAENPAWSPDQARCLEEWRNLCFTLERAQVEHLVENCRDKFQFAKTFLVYGRDLDQLTSEIAQSASQGNYQFFGQRGIRTDILTPGMADQMVRDWRGAIASKKARAAEAFRGRFCEEVEHFVAMPQNAPRLIMAAALEEADAIVLIGALAEDATTPSSGEIARLRADVAQLRGQIADLSDKVLTQLSAITAKLG